MEVVLISIVVLAFIIAWGLFMITLPKNGIDTRSMDVNPMAFGEMESDIQMMQNMMSRMDYDIECMKKKDPVPDSQKPILIVREFYNIVKSEK